MKPLFSTCCQCEAISIPFFGSCYYCTDCREPCEVYDPEEKEPQPPIVCKNCGHPINEFEDFCAACLVEEDDPEGEDICFICGHPLPDDEVPFGEECCQSCLDKINKQEPDNENAHEDYERIEARKRDER